MCANINIRNIINNEEININMEYSVAVTKSGQMTLPKAVREMMGITNRAIVRFSRGKSVSVYKQPSMEERFAEVRASFSPETKEAIKRTAGKTKEELEAEWLNSLESKKYYKEKYGI